MDKCFKQVINRFGIEKVGRHVDHGAVLLLCQLEKQGYHSSKDLSERSKQTTLVTLLAG